MSQFSGFHGGLFSGAGGDTQFAEHGVLHGPHLFLFGFLAVVVAQQVQSAVHG